MLRITFKELFEATGPIMERSTLTYDQLFRRSDPKRTFRSAQVRGPPLEIDSYKDAIFHTFNFKSYPSTTGLRHRGYIKFERPTHNRPMPSEKIPCVVDCTCPDFKYRWAWANKQRGASRIGNQSLNQCIDRAPRKTNPSGKVGLCKHLLAARNYIYGLIQTFDKEQPASQRARGKGTQNLAWKLDQLVKYANKRWTDWDAQTSAGKQRQVIQRQVQQARNVAGPMPAAEVPRGIDQETPPPLPPETPPGQTPPTGNITPTPPVPTTPATTRESPNQTREESIVVNAATDNSNIESMKNNLLTQSKSIIEAMQDDDHLAAEVTNATLGDEAAGGEAGEMSSDLPPPPEEVGMGEELPPEAAEGAPEDEALGLLRDIATGISRLADELAPIEAEAELELGAEGAEGAEHEHEEHEEGEEEENEAGVPPVEDEDEFSETMPVATGA